ncbi:helix-turn-helix transcriptional regulator [Sphaerisporangium sp. NPDC051011]|uniref:helix-turn-helix domain-containing protein n=1 Tax=Sphaerisporangium sp. NPDC051011 TaxID=3155792 RepID=UPI0034059F9A
MRLESQVSSPTVKRRRLSAALRQLRVECGLTAAEAAKQLDWDPSKITRMERDEWKRPAPHDIRGLLDLYGVTDERRREALLTLARESRQRGWWADYQDVFRSSLPDFEAGASMIRSYEALLIPGLLQTAEYTAAVLRGGQVLGEAVIERRVQARLARQQIISREDPPELVIVIDEAALHRMTGGAGVMRAQLEHVIDMATRPNITVQVLPLSVGSHPAMTGGAFLILDFPSPDDPSLVYMETATDDLWLETPEELRRYTLIFSQVQGLALSPDESVHHMAALVDRLER